MVTCCVHRINLVWNGLSNLSNTNDADVLHIMAGTSTSATSDSLWRIAKRNGTLTGTQINLTVPDTCFSLRWSTDGAANCAKSGRCDKRTVAYGWVLYYEADLPPGTETAPTSSPTPSVSIPLNSAALSWLSPTAHADGSFAFSFLVRLGVPVPGVPVTLLQLPGGNTFRSIGFVPDAGLYRVQVCTAYQMAAYAGEQWLVVMFTYATGIVYSSVIGNYLRGAFTLFIDGSFVGSVAVGFGGLYYTYRPVVGAPFTVLPSWQGNVKEFKWFDGPMAADRVAAEYASTAAAFPGVKNETNSPTSAPTAPTGMPTAVPTFANEPYTRYTWRATDLAVGSYANTWPSTDSLLSLIAIHPTALYSAGTVSDHPAGHAGVRLAGNAGYVASSFQTSTGRVTLSISVDADYTGPLLTFTNFGIRLTLASAASNSTTLTGDTADKSCSFANGKVAGGAWYRMLHLVWHGSMWRVHLDGGRLCTPSWSAPLFAGPLLWFDGGTGFVYDAALYAAALSDEQVAADAIDRLYGNIGLLPPTFEPSASPSSSPTMLQPTSAPVTVAPSTEAPTVEPTTASPTTIAPVAPTTNPTQLPSAVPTQAPTFPALAPRDAALARRVLPVTGFPVDTMQPIAPWACTQANCFCVADEGVFFVDERRVLDASASFVYWWSATNPQARPVQLADTQTAKRVMCSDTTLLAFMQTGEVRLYTRNASACSALACGDGTDVPGRFVFNATSRSSVAIARASNTSVWRNGVLLQPGVTTDAETDATVDEGFSPRSLMGIMFVENTSTLAAITYTTDRRLVSDASAVGALVIRVVVLPFGVRMRSLSAAPLTSDLALFAAVTFMQVSGVSVIDPAEVPAPSCMLCYWYARITSTPNALPVFGDNTVTSTWSLGEASGIAGTNLSVTCRLDAVPVLPLKDNTGNSVSGIVRAAFRQGTSTQGLVRAALFIEPRAVLSNLGYPVNAPFTWLCHIDLNSGDLLPVMACQTTVPFLATAAGTGFATGLLVAVSPRQITRAPVDGQGQLDAIAISTRVTASGFTLQLLEVPRGRGSLVTSADFPIRASYDIGSADGLLESLDTACMDVDWSNSTRFMYRYNYAITTTSVGVSGLAPPVVYTSADSAGLDEEADTIYGTTQHIRHVDSSASGVLWIGTTSGLYRFQLLPERWEPLVDVNGRPVDVASGLVAGSILKVAPTDVLNVVLTDGSAVANGVWLTLVPQSSAVSSGLVFPLSVVHLHAATSGSGAHGITLDLGAIPALRGTGAGGVYSIVLSEEYYPIQAPRAVDNITLVVAGVAVDQYDVTIPRSLHRTTVVSIPLIVAPAAAPPLPQAVASASAFTLPALIGSRQTIGWGSLRTVLARVNQTSSALIRRTMRVTSAAEQLIALTSTHLVSVSVPFAAAPTSQGPSSRVIGVTALPPECLGGESVLDSVSMDETMRQYYVVCRRPSAQSVAWASRANTTTSLLFAFSMDHPFAVSAAPVEFSDPTSVRGHFTVLCMGDTRSPVVIRGADPYRIGDYPAPISVGVPGSGASVRVPAVVVPVPVASYWPLDGQCLACTDASMPALDCSVYGAGRATVPPGRAKEAPLEWSYFPESALLSGFPPGSRAAVAFPPGAVVACASGSVFQRIQDQRQWAVGASVRPLFVHASSVAAGPCHVTRLGAPDGASIATQRNCRIGYGCADEVRGVEVVSNSMEDEAVFVLAVVPNPGGVSGVARVYSLAVDQTLAATTLAAVDVSVSDAMGSASDWVPFVSRTTGTVSVADALLDLDFRTGALAVRATAPVNYTGPGLWMAEWPAGNAVLVYNSSSLDLVYWKGASGASGSDQSTSVCAAEVTGGPLPVFGGTNDAGLCTEDGLGVSRRPFGSWYANLADPYSYAAGSMPVDPSESLLTFNAWKYVPGANGAPILESTYLRACREAERPRRYSSLPWLLTCYPPPRAGRSTEWVVRTTDASYVQAMDPRCATWGAVGVDVAPVDGLWDMQYSLCIEAQYREYLHAQFTVHSVTQQVGDWPMSAYVSYGRVSLPVPFRFAALEARGIMDVMPFVRLCRGPELLSACIMDERACLAVDTTMQLTSDFGPGASPGSFDGGGAVVAVSCDEAFWESNAVSDTGQWGAAEWQEAMNSGALTWIKPANVWSSPGAAGGYPFHEGAAVADIDTMPAADDTWSASTASTPCNVSDAFNACVSLDGSREIPSISCATRTVRGKPAGRFMFTYTVRICPYGYAIKYPVLEDATIAAQLEAERVLDARAASVTLAQYASFCGPCWANATAAFCASDMSSAWCGLPGSRPVVTNWKADGQPLTVDLSTCDCAFCGPSLLDNRPCAVRTPKACSNHSWEPTSAQALCGPSAVSCSYTCSGASHGSPTCRAEPGSCVCDAYAAWAAPSGGDMGGGRVTADGWVMVAASGVGLSNVNLTSKSALPCVPNATALSPADAVRYCGKYALAAVAHSANNVSWYSCRQATATGAGAQQAALAASAPYELAAHSLTGVYPGDWRSAFLSSSTPPNAGPLVLSVDTLGGAIHGTAQIPPVTVLGSIAVAAALGVPDVDRDVFMRGHPHFDCGWTPDALASLSYPGMTPADLYYESSLYAGFVESYQRQAASPCATGELPVRGRGAGLWSLNAVSQTEMFNGAARTATMATSAQPSPALVGPDAPVQSPDAVLYLTLSNAEDQPDLDFLDVTLTTKLVPNERHVVAWAEAVSVVRGSSAAPLSLVIAAMDANAWAQALLADLSVTGLGYRVAFYYCKPNSATDCIEDVGGGKVFAVSISEGWATQTGVQTAGYFYSGYTTLVLRFTRTAKTWLVNATTKDAATLSHLSMCLARLYPALPWYRALDICDLEEYASYYRVPHGDPPRVHVRHKAGQVLLLLDAFSVQRVALDTDASGSRASWDIPGLVAHHDFSTDLSGGATQGPGVRFMTQPAYVADFARVGALSPRAPSVPGAAFVFLRTQSTAYSCVYLVTEAAHGPRYTKSIWATFADGAISNLAASPSRQRSDLLSSVSGVDDAPAEVLAIRPAGSAGPQAMVWCGTSRGGTVGTLFGARALVKFDSLLGWTHFVCTRDSGGLVASLGGAVETYTLYINGTQVDRRERVVPVIWAGTDYLLRTGTWTSPRLARDSGAGPGPYDALGLWRADGILPTGVDNIGVYARALVAQEVSVLYAYDNDYNPAAVAAILASWKVPDPSAYSPDAFPVQIVYPLSEDATGVLWGMNTSTSVNATASCRAGLAAEAARMRYAGVNASHPLVAAQCAAAAEVGMEKCIGYYGTGGLRGNASLSCVFSAGVQYTPSGYVSTRGPLATLTGAYRQCEAGAWSAYSNSSARCVGVQVAGGMFWTVHAEASSYALAGGGNNTFYQMACTSPVMRRCGARLVPLPTPGTSSSAFLHFRPERVVTGQSSAIVDATNGQCITLTAPIYTRTDTGISYLNASSSFTVRLTVLCESADASSNVIVFPDCVDGTTASLAPLSSGRSEMLDSAVSSTAYPLTTARVSPVCAQCTPPRYLFTAPVYTGAGRSAVRHVDSEPDSPTYGQNMTLSFHLGVSCAPTWKATTVTLACTAGEVRATCGGAGLACFKVCKSSLGSAAFDCVAPELASCTCPEMYDWAAAQARSGPLCVARATRQCLPAEYIAAGCILGSSTCIVDCAVGGGCVVRPAGCYDTAPAPRPCSPEESAANCGSEVARETYAMTDAVTRCTQMAVRVGPSTWLPATSSANCGCAGSVPFASNATGNPDAAAQWLDDRAMVCIMRGIFPQHSLYNGVDGQPWCEYTDYITAAQKCMGLPACLGIQTYDNLPGSNRTCYGLRTDGIPRPVDSYNSSVYVKHCAASHAHPSYIDYAGERSRAQCACGGAKLVSGLRGALTWTCPGMRVPCTDFQTAAYCGPRNPLLIQHGVDSYAASYGVQRSDRCEFYPFGTPANSTARVVPGSCPGEFTLRMCAASEVAAYCPSANAMGCVMRCPTGSASTSFASLSLKESLGAGCVRWGRCHTKRNCTPIEVPALCGITNMYSSAASSSSYSTRVGLYTDTSDSAAGPTPMNAVGAFSAGLGSRAKACTLYETQTSQGVQVQALSCTWNCTDGYLPKFDGTGCLPPAAFNRSGIPCSTEDAFRYCGLATRVASCAYTDSGEVPRCSCVGGAGPGKLDAKQCSGTVVTCDQAPDICAATLGPYYGSASMSCQGPAYSIAVGATAHAVPPAPTFLFDFEPNTVAWSQDRARTERPYTFLYHWNASVSPGAQLGKVRHATATDAARSRG